jgi:hypothetical protein
LYLEATMLTPDASERALRDYFRQHRIAELRELFQLLGTRSRMSVFRRLKAVGYRSSFNHAGRYYTLADVPQFDRWGLWFHADAGFSRAGTLKDTVVALVDSSAAGMTPKELLALLRLPVANTLSNTLHSVRQEARIACHGLDGEQLYISADAQRAKRQRMQRRQALEGAPSAPVAVSEELVIAILVEALQGAQVLMSAALVASRLTARAVAVTTAQVEQVFARYGLTPGKKTLA